MMEKSGVRNLLAPRQPDAVGEKGVRDKYTAFKIMPRGTHSFHKTPSPNNLLRIHSVLALPVD